MRRVVADEVRRVDEAVADLVEVDDARDLEGEAAADHAHHATALLRGPAGGGQAE